MTDLEALIAGIAADPDNDLRRLVFADWLEENGESERAEFIRLSVSLSDWSDSEAREDRKARAEALFDAHWSHWFAPFFATAAPGCDASMFEPSQPESLCPWLGFSTRSDTRAREYLDDWPIEVTRGFVEHIAIDARLNPPRDVFASAFGIEPIHSLDVKLDHPTQWRQLSSAAFQQLVTLDLTEVIEGNAAPLVGVIPAFEDDRLVNVRRLTLGAETANDTDYLLGAHIPRETVARFADSPLALRVRELRLGCVSHLGIRALGTVQDVAWDRLAIHVLPSHESGAALREAKFVRRLRVLELQFEPLHGGSEAVSHFLRSAFLTAEWPNLRELHFPLLDLRDDDLWELVDTGIAAQLETLTFRAGFRGYTPALRAVLESLDLERLRLLYVSGFHTREPIPEEWQARFGNRLDTRNQSLMIHSATAQPPAGSSKSGC